VAFGVDSSGLAGRSVGLSKTLAMLIGPLSLLGDASIEQLLLATNSQLELGEWGSLLERTHLAVATVDCLPSYLLTGGRVSTHNKSKVGRVDC
jgi:hypothetical protein